MGYAAVRVADVDLFVGAQNAELDLARFFASAKHTPQAKLDILCAPVPGNHNEICPLFEANQLHLVIDNVEQDLFDILRHVAFLAGTLSQHYAFFHAAGLIIKGKGVLLIGRSGVGKSTLAKQLGGQVIDDDMLMVSERKMMRVSRYGAHIKEDNRTVRLAEDEHDHATVDVVFILDKSAEPNSMTQVTADAIDTRETFDDNLHPGLFARYDRAATPRFRAPVYRIGTKRAPGESKRVVEYILQHLP